MRVSALLTHSGERVTGYVRSEGLRSSSTAYNNRTNYREQEQGTIELESTLAHGSIGGIRTIRRADRSSSDNSGDRRHRRDCVGEEEEIPEKVAFDERRRGGGSTLRGEER